MMFSYLRSHKNRQAGFTLIEILIVMVIIAFLASLSAGSFQSSQRKARDTRRKNDLHSISTALETYYNDVGSYPLSSIDGSIVGCNGEQECDAGEAFADDKGTVYMVKLPQDPFADRGYEYIYNSDGSSYQIFARLENTDDPAVPKNGSDEAQVYGTLLCADEVGCNYGVSSTNTLPAEGHALTDEE